MPSSPSRLEHLLELYLDNNCTERELTEFWQLLFDLQEKDMIAEELQKLWNTEDTGNTPGSFVKWESVYEKLIQKKMPARIMNNHYINTEATKEKMQAGCFKKLTGIMLELNGFYAMPALIGMLRKNNNRM
ncbi:hypothetical protein [Foetidibacter luteolus]|uniref:hypothetical protein n=1 Tax=Foetidibacter luteolus TaxID=2608880 RepID=UPI00129A6968|nr:hypothetical protein [Foetidibacter luteolus]